MDSKIYDRTKPLISQHIPKCAGTSFSSVLRTWFGKKYRTHYYSEKRNSPPKKHSLYSGIFRKKAIEGLCIHGHFNNNRGIGIDTYYPESSQIITVLRDPFELHVSNYYYVIRSAQEGSDGGFRSGEPNPIIKNKWSLEDYLNHMSQSLMTNFFPKEMNEENYTDIIDNRFLYVGISENLQTTIDQLAKILSFESIKAPEENIASRYDDIPSGAREDFISKNKLIMDVYEYSKVKFG